MTLPAAALGGGPPSYLHPGQILVAEAPAQVLTILGTCVSVCLWDPVRRQGGINHFLLPRWVEGADKTSRYGNVAIELLLERLAQKGSFPSSLEAKICGGMASRQGITTRDLGASNVQIARELLSAAGIPIRGEHVGGLRGRKLLFSIGEGNTWVKEL